MKTKNIFFKFLVLILAIVFFSSVFANKSSAFVIANENMTNDNIVDVESLANYRVVLKNLINLK